MKRIFLTMALCLTAFLLVFGTAAAEVPTVTSENVAYEAFGAKGDGTTADSPIGTLAGSAALLPDGGTLVVTNKLYIGTAAKLPRLNGALKITAKHGDEDFTGVADNALILENGGILEIQSDVIIDDITINMRNKKVGVIRVNTGATLYIGANVAVKGTGGCYPAIELAGGTAILDGGTFSRVTGEGTLLNNGASVVGAAIPTVTSDAYVYASFAGKDANDGLSAATPKKGIGNANGSGIFSMVKDGGTVIVSGKLYFGDDYTWKAGSAVKITGISNQNKDNQKDYRDGNNAGMMKMKVGKTLTVQSDLILDDITLFQETSGTNKIVVANGATLVIGKNVACTTDKGNWFEIVVNAGGTVVLNGGIFGSVSGEGSIYNNGAEIKNHEHTKKGIVTKEATTLETGTIEYACTTCGLAMGSEEIQLLPVPILTKVSCMAAAYTDGKATVRYIVKLEIAEGVKVENYGVMIAQNAEKMNVRRASLTETFDTATTFAVDLVEIPESAFDTEIYAWAFVNLADGNSIVLPINPVTVNAFNPGKAGN